jgi:hypothetical protein
VVVDTGLSLPDRDFIGTLGALREMLASFEPSLASV